MYELPGSRRTPDTFNVRDIINANRKYNCYTADQSMMMDS